MTCKNCDHTFEGFFCNKCGQKGSIQRINWTYLKEEIFSSIFQLNKGIFFTIKELFVRPGQSIREFLAGKRKKHFKPIGFVFLTATLYFLVSHFVGKQTFLASAISGIADGLGEGENESTLAVNILNWMANNHAYSTLLIMPIFSLASYLAFKKANYNYFEHLILNAFITGQQMVIYLVLSLLFFSLNDDNYLTQGIPIFSGFFFNIWVLFRFFNTIKLFRKTSLIIITYIYFIGLMILSIIAIMFISGIK